MLVVLPVCQKDSELALLNLKLCRKLDQRTEFPVVISHDAKFDPKQIVDSAQGYFSKVHTLTYEPWSGDQKWPQPQNWAWQQTAKFLAAKGNTSPWLWWEADATPLRPGWLKLIWDRYRESGKPFLGHLVRDVIPGGHMNGVGVWPARVADYFHDPLLCRETPFDIAAAPVTVETMAIANDLIGWWRKEHGQAAFKTWAEVELLLRQRLVLYHGCENGTLAQLLLDQKAVSKRLWPKLAFIKRKPELKLFEPEAKLEKISEPKIWLGVERHVPKDRAEERRMQWAWESWMKLDNVEIVQFEEPYPRDSGAVGDPRRLPYIKDVIAAAAANAQPYEIAGFVNSDIFLHADTPTLIREKLQSFPAAVGKKLQFKTRPSATLKRQTLVEKGEPDLGRDLFAFRMSWLKDYWPKLPDLYMGEAVGDLLLWALIRKIEGLSQDKSISFDPIIDLPMGTVIHVQHQQRWTKAEGNPAKLHAYNVKNEFVAKYGLEVPC